MKKSNLLLVLFIVLLVFIVGCTEQTSEEEIMGYCCIDKALKIGSYNEEPCEGDDLNVESLPSESAESCKELVLSKGYRYSPLYKTTSEFALVCTEGISRGKYIPCSLDDKNFFDASFQGHILGVEVLKEEVGYLPKEKMEFHLASDNFCFPEGYEEIAIHTGYARQIGGHPVLCNSGHYYYLKFMGTPEERSLDYYKSLESQELIIHEPIHRIFIDYYRREPPVPKSYSPPEYKIQESFAKAVSLVEIGLMKDYGEDSILNWNGVYSLDNLPPEESHVINNFFIYSLNQRYGFDEEDTREFFKRYRDTENVVIDGNLRVKTILDDILGTDTAASFQDVGIEFDYEPKLKKKP